MTNNNSNSQRFFELYVPYHDQLRNYCEIISKDREIARDLLNDAILVGLESFSKLKEQEKFIYFLFGIAKNLHRRILRKKKFWVTNALYQSEWIQSKDNPELDADVQLLYAMIDQLPELQKEAILLFEISGFSIKEIQEIQQANSSAVKQRLKRGRERLKLLMNEPQKAQA